MYSSLHKIDIVAELDGEKLVVQTDHRTPEEIEAEPELSVLFAMTRVLNARAWLASEGHSGKVRYTMQAAAPPLLRAALAAVGASLSEAGSPAEDLGHPSLVIAGELADQAFRGLAARVLARLATADATDALQTLESQTRAGSLDREADEISYFTRIAELAALGGELIRMKAGGRWMHHEQALMPFGFRIDQGAVVFPTNRAERFVADGGTESVLHLLSAVDDVLANRGGTRAMPSLRHRDRIPLDRVAWRPLMAEDNPALPVVVFGEDGENTFALYDQASLEEPVELLAARALENLAAEEVAIERMEVQGLVLVAVGGGFYAAEKLLDPELLRKIHRMLGSDALAAAVPARGLLLATSASQPSDRLGLFAAVAQRRFDDAGQQAISAAVVLVHDGELVGFGSVDTLGGPVGES